ncbi:MAG: TraR/DksA family transcriptional regulator [Propionibacteriaceae bacterium]|nr:TraR/DksA family transcriptional regulator [Propionibacteriaceae bacterium]
MPKVTITLPVAEGEDPWTSGEIEEVRQELQDDVERLSAAVQKSQAELDELFSESNDGAGRDAADVGSSNFERDQEMSLVRNAQLILDQAQNALKLFEAGEYGWCESCGKPIGKDRLQIFPRATLCVECKRQAERR